ncbi:MAG: RNA polymerase sigma-54 factor [Phycisphaerae bacterium]|nr:MAG: RNA polymerase factor sigma-54 [Planctomycetia bacterium]RIK70749.1 MAG: RNA polymerase sigma-54 factor [Planctomycetota bacterium]GJQ27220.1 MAG: RNA polymerase sigma-54 factor [Phycisphaerae bacterium]
MSQYMSMMPSQQMRLEQRLTPQLIQSMEILTLPLMALEARVREELESNPVLELLEPEGKEEAGPPKEDLPATETNLAEAESFERLDRMTRELELDPGDLPFGRAGSSAASGERDAKLDAMANTASREEALRDQLSRQWSLMEMPESLRRPGQVLIDWMDDDGYLRSEAEHHTKGGNGDDQLETTPLIIQRTPEEARRLLEEIGASVQPPIDVAVLEQALTLVQTLEPAGVGARDLTECLLIQLAGQENVDPLCEEIVRKYLVELAKNNFPAVAKATGRSIEEIKEALRVIGRLNHHPGHLVRPGDVQGITPDIIVDHAEEGDGYDVRLARGNTPRLRISPHYREMLQDRETDKEAREFIRRRMEAATTIIDAIAFRRQRLLEIAKIILDRQREFFDFGPQFLKVLRMRDLAEELNCDASTISRTVDGKYIQTPRGIFPLRMFFTGGTTDGSGEAVSWNSIKAKVKEIIDKEDKKNPLSDDEIVKLLTESGGTPIARRTVAKYRAQLNIPSVRERREY